MPDPYRTWLLASGTLLFLGALLHLAAIAGGPGWFAFLGAPEGLVALARTDSLRPAISCVLIAGVLSVAAAYAFSAAGLIRRLPAPRVVLALVGFGLVTRGLVFLPLAAWRPHLLSGLCGKCAEPGLFLVATSALCLFIGLGYLLGALPHRGPGGPEPQAGPSPEGGRLDASWTRAWTGLQARGDGLALKQQLLAAWAEPARHYHTLQHLSECLGLFDRHRDLADEPAEVEIALWFHDAIYQVRRSDNELKSALWAEAELRKAGVAEARIARVHAHILATRHSALPEGRDQQLLVDIDLSILGAPRPRYEEYERQVREEYRWVPAFLFNAKRQSILATFLARDPIYHTPRLREALEPMARGNLAWSLQQPAH